MSNLGPQLTLWFSKPCALLFWFRPIDFPSKMMPCKLNQNLICLYPEPMSKVLETNLKLLTNRNAQFHWTLLLGSLSKMTLSLHVLSQTLFSLFFSQFFDIENMENFQKISKITRIYTRKRKFRNLSQFLCGFSNKNGWEKNH